MVIRNVCERKTADILRRLETGTLLKDLKALVLKGLVVYHLGA